MKRLFASLLPFLALAPLGPTAFAATPTETVTRRDLLTAAINPARKISTVVIKEITLPPRLAAGLHLHPGTVAGIVTAGTILFQLEGGPVRQLRPGDAFCEPADVRVARFDNGGETPATFTAVYLVSADQHELIRMLPR
jgi:quercetin dioxygenase-like cupin family protein